MATIKIKRGNNANLDGLTLAQGEPAFTLDTKKLYIGDGTEKACINPDAINLLTSSDTALALSAAMGKKLQDEKAPKASPSFTGTPTAPTATNGTNTTQLATTAFVNAAVTALVNSSPAALDTLQELAAALGNDPNFATTITNALAAKAPLASPALTGMPTAPTASSGTNTTQIATTAYVKAQAYAALASPSFSGTPTAPTPTTADNTTKIATTAFVRNYVASLGALTDSGPVDGGVF